MVAAHVAGHDSLPLRLGAGGDVKSQEGYHNPLPNGASEGEYLWVLTVEQTFGGAELDSVSSGFPLGRQRWQALGLLEEMPLLGEIEGDFLRARAARVTASKGLEEGGCGLVTLDRGRRPVGDLWHLYPG